MSYEEDAARFKEWVTTRYCGHTLEIPYKKTLFDPEIQRVSIPIQIVWQLAAEAYHKGMTDAREEFDKAKH